MQAPLTVVLGELDDDHHHKHLNRSEGAMQQGPHRLARGRHFYEAARPTAARPSTQPTISIDAASPLLPCHQSTVALPSLSRYDLAPTAARPHGRFKKSTREKLIVAQCYAGRGSAARARSHSARIATHIPALTFAPPPCPHC
jgi:hypothetical protein